MSKKILNLIGEIDLNTEFDIIFSKKYDFLVTNVVGDTHYFEMTGETMYYALTEYERRTGTSQKEKKQRIINAILNRKTFCGGILYHQSFQDENDTQLRSTSAVIRTLLTSKNEGFQVEKDLKDVYTHHFSYYFEWKNGIWFCHDTSEKEGKTPFSHIKAESWGKERRNTVTLNTHLDSLTSLLMLINAENNDLTESYEELARKAVVSINFILKTRHRKTTLNSYLQTLDDFLFKKYITHLKSKSTIGVAYQKLLHPFLLKVLSPTLFFRNGYIGRDLSVANIHVDYLAVNITDFLRLLVTYDSLPDIIKVKLGPLNRSGILEVVTKAIALIEGSSIKQYILSEEIQLAWYAEMHYLYSFYDSKYETILNKLKETKCFNFETTSFVQNYRKS